MDRTFLAPRVNVYLQILSNPIRDTAKNFLMFNMFYNYINNALEIKLSAAKDAGIDITTSFNEK